MTPLNLRKAIWVLAHADYFSLSLPVYSNFDQAAGSSYQWRILTPVLRLRTNLQQVHAWCKVFATHKVTYSDTRFHVSSTATSHFDSLVKAILPHCSTSHASTAARIWRTLQIETSLKSFFFSYSFFSQKTYLVTSWHFYYKPCNLRII